MSTDKYAAPTAPWAIHRERDEVVGELTAIEEQLAEALAGRGRLTEAERLELEDQRRILKQELRELDAKEFHADEDGIIPEAPGVMGQEATQTYPLPEARRRWLARMNKGKAGGAGNCGDEEAELRAQVAAMTAKVEENEAALVDLRRKFRALGYRLPTDQRLEFLDPAGNMLVIHRPHGEKSFALPWFPEEAN